MRLGDRCLFLIGFMGSGKSAVGRVVARKIGWAFRDTDEMIEAAEGRSIETIFRESGEGFFRGVEWKVLRGLAGATRTVIATGGGLFLGSSQRRWIRTAGVSVWLDVPLEVIRKRAGAGRGRPLWIDDDPVDLRALFERRRAAYALADLRLPAVRETEGALASRLLDRLDAVLR